MTAWTPPPPGDRREQLGGVILRVQALAAEYPVAIPTHLIDEALDQPAPDTSTGHVYLSTGCLHGDHAYCKAMTGMNGAKRPGECKHCRAHCVCGCHTEPAPA